MKLQSKIILPVEARDNLVAKLGPIDNGISDMRLALETAEQQCFDLNEELMKKEKAFVNVAYKLGNLLKDEKQF